MRETDFHHRKFHEDEKKKKADIPVHDIISRLETDVDTFLSHKRIRNREHLTAFLRVVNRSALSLVVDCYIDCSVR